jgi:transposase
MKNKELDFTNQIIYLGIDAHKNSWEILPISSGIELKRQSMPPSPEGLAKYLHKNYPNATIVSVYEAGFCGFWIHRRLQALGINNIICNPADVPSKIKERQKKNDRVDARKLARELSSGNLKPIHIPDEQQESRRALCRLRVQLVKDQTRTKNRIKSFLNFKGVEVPTDDGLKHWSGNYIKYLDELTFEHKESRLTLDGLLESLKYQRGQIVKVTKNIRSMVREDKEISKVVKRLMSVPGVGFITAVTFCTEIMDIKRFNKLDRLSDYVGFVPAESYSGEKERILGLSNQQNKFLRNLIIESAWTAIRKDPALMMAYGKYVQRMQPQEAIIRIAKKLLNRIMHVWKNDCDYVCSVVE